MTLPETAAMVLGIPLIYVAGATVALSWRGLTPAQRWRIAQWAAAIALAAALAAALSRVLVPVSPAFAGWPHASDAIGQTMLVLVSFLGWVIVRFSAVYLDGERRQSHYLAALLLTLAAVAVVALSDHLGVLVCAWIASSLGLHRLLTFYRGRPAALIAAHKKFLASRLAELCLAGALALIYSETATLSFEGIGEHLRQLAALPWTLQAAAMLVALAAILKSAQLPIHGWLIQVMEAPTPVSALLHAGIVNLGGFVLIRMAGLLSAAPAAQALLVVVGSLTAVVASLVMMTRISIKVRLAWSTCAQMGFMLMECGLGLYELAFLHLIAHSLYKAHAFLSAGEAVLDTRLRAMMPVDAGATPAARLRAALLSAPLAIALFAASAFCWRLALPGLALPEMVIFIVGLALAPLLAGSAGARIGSLGVLRVIALAQIYMVWHLLFATLVDLPPVRVSPLLALWVGSCFAMLYLLQCWLLAYPRSALSAALYPWAYAGFYLDERFTRLTFRIWPVRLPVDAVPAAQTPPLASPLGENA